MWLPLLCEKTRTVTLAQLGLTAGRLAGRQNAEIFKIILKIKKGAGITIKSKELSGKLVI